MSTAQLVGIAVGLIAALLFGGGAVAQAHAVRRHEASPDDLGGFVARSVRDPWTILVVLAYLVGFVLHAVAILLLPLYLAQATIAMSLPVTALSSRAVHERLTAAHWWSIAIVTLGLVVLSIGSGEAGTLVIHPEFAIALWVGAVLLALAGWRNGLLGGGTLGALSGLGYAGSAIAVRGVGTPVEPVVVACALAVPVYGLLAFWIYSIGLDRAPVSSTTAPLIVGQTFVPALVGVLLLGDGVRDGWGWAVVAGLVLSTLGAILLSRTDVRSSASAETGSAQDPSRRRRPAPRRSTT